MDRYGCLDLRFKKKNEKCGHKIFKRPVQIWDLNENENLNTLEKSERTEIIGGFHLRDRLVAGTRYEKGGENDFHIFHTK